MFAYLCFMNKAALRQLYLQKRKAMASEAVHEQSLLIKQRFFESIDLSNVHYLHTFLPILKQQEINTLLIVDELRATYPHIKLVVSRSLPETGELEHYLYDSTQLELSKWGIPEPIPNHITRVAEESIDAVLVPMLVADEQGNRVGYGKGFYDRFLQKCRPDIQKIGLCFEEPILQIADTNALDIPLSVVVSPLKVFVFNTSYTGL